MSSTVGASVCVALVDEVTGSFAAFVPDVLMWRDKRFRFCDIVRWARGFLRAGDVSAGAGLDSFDISRKSSPRSRATDHGKSPQIIGFMLVHHFSMIAFTAAIEPLRLANRVTGTTLYEWRLYSVDGASVEASNGVKVEVELSFAQARDIDAVVVCSGINVQTIDHRVLVAAVRRLTKFGAAAGAVCTGAYVLAKAGLLDGYRSTIHWENRPGMQADFPELDIGEDLFEIDRDRFTCAGGVAAADMMLSLIKRDHGEEASAAVTEQLIHHRIRDASERQRIDLRTRLGVAHPKLLRVVNLMEQSIGRPLPMSQFAASVALSNRQLERLFWKHLGYPPSKHYLKLRLEHACQLLRQTAMPILSVAMASGFNSASYFSQSYIDYFGHSPSAERKGLLLKD